MGPPLYIINYERKEYISLGAGGVTGHQLSILLPFYANLVEHGNWNTTGNNINVFDISSNDDGIDDEETELKLKINNISICYVYFGGIEEYDLINEYTCILTIAPEAVKQLVKI